MCHKAHGEAASTTLNTVTHSYYDSILTAYTPAIDHGQDSDRGGLAAAVALGSKRVFEKGLNRRHVEMASPRVRCTAVLYCTELYRRQARAELMNTAVLRRDELS